MTNYEHYKNEIEKYARFGIEVALKKDIDRIVPCANISCDDCLFHLGTCADKKTQWADEKYQEPEVDWTKVLMDTPILVRAREDYKWYKRHFARYEDNKVYAWENGKTSFTAGDYSSCAHWEFAKLAEEE